MGQYYKYVAEDVKHLLQVFFFLKKLKSEMHIAVWSRRIILHKKLK